MAARFLYCVCFGHCSKSDTIGGRGFSRTTAAIAVVKVAATETVEEAVMEVPETVVTVSVGLATLGVATMNTLR